MQEGSFSPCDEDSSFDSLFHHVYLIIYTILKVYGHDHSFYLLLPYWIYFVRCLFTSFFINKEDVEDPYKATALQHVFSMPHLCLRHQLACPETCIDHLVRLFEALAKHDKAFSKHAPYLISDFIHLQRWLPLPVSIHTRLVPGIYAMFRICSEHEFKLINIWQDGAGQAIFQSLYAHYTKHYKYLGKV
jgi:hypothetical protein